MPHITKYNARWPDSMPPLEIELKCIEWGGKWKGKDGNECGLGLFEHFMNARKLCWPNRYRHRWTELMYRNFIANDLTVLMGGASTQKTSHAVEFCLLNYFAKPFNTLIILSTVNMEKLEIGVWGETKMLWAEARRRHDWLAGNVIDHKKALSTDSLEDGDVRDMRRGVISRPTYVGGKWVGLGILAGLKQENIIYFADECFPSGTLVDTPSGRLPIESISIGDLVHTAIGPRKVKQTSCNHVSTLVRVRTKDNRKIVCTPDHKIFTQKGWVKAIDLNREHYIISTYESHEIMCGVRKEIRSVRESVRKGEILRSMQEAKASVRSVRKNIYSIMSEIDRAFLLSELWWKMEPQSAGYSRKDFYGGKEQEGFDWSKTALGKQSRAEKRTIHSHDSEQSNVQEWTQWASSDKHSTKNVFSCEAKRNQWIGARGADKTDSRGTDSTRCLSWFNLEFGNKKIQEERWMLESRCCISGNKIRRRGGWCESHEHSKATTRPSSHSRPRGSWVESCQVLEQNDFERYSGGNSRVEVYNLHVEGHHSYSVNGFLVANCQFMQQAFSLSWPHLFSNGNVKIIASGNPRHDTSDELGVTAEPKCGWAAMPEPEKTQVWETKFMGGHCINLVGTDSPNFDVPDGSPEPYPRLIGRKFANRIAHDHGSGSFEFYRLVKGVMKIAFASSRVITRQLCREHRALEQPKWKDNKQTHIYALDPSYGGEDRCVGMPGKFGEDVDGKLILELMPYREFKLDLRKEKAIEDQIADILAEELDTYNVIPENCFYDSTGKGTIGAALARKFGHRVPVAVDSGAHPTKRPVREDLYVEENGAKRLKRCDEHYSKFVTEMWFSVRYAIEAEQVRGLLDDVMEEGCARVYEIVKGNKFEIEAKSDPKKKEDLKRRLGKSPDLFDAAVILCEGARQRGFKIRRLGSTKDTDNDAFQWLNDRVRKHEELIKSKQLNYA